MFVNNFGKRGPIFKFCHQLIHEKILYVYVHHKDFHLTCYVLLHDLLKVENPKFYWFWQHPKQTDDMFLRTHWALDLTFNGS